MKYSHYRNREEIMALILASADKPEGISKTRVMFNCFVSYAQLTEYLVHLTKSGLVQHDHASKLYKTTTKGLYFLDLHNKMEEITKIQTSLPIGKNRL